MVRVRSYSNFDAWVDTVDQTWKVGDHSNKKRNNGPPIAAVAIAVDTVRLVQGKSVVLPPMNKPEVKHHDRRYRSEEHSVRNHEVEEAACAGEDLPGHQCPRKNRTDKLATSNIDELREQCCQVVGCGQ